MGLLHLFLAASMPVVKVFLLISLGLFLALDHVDVLGSTACKLLNKVVFFVFGPSLVGSSLAKTITIKGFLTLWFMPVNISCTFVFGSILGWILVKITRPPKHLKGLIIGACSAGNLGFILVIIIPAMCKEKGSPLGAPDVCQTYGLSYSLLSLAFGTVFMWVYVYNIVRMYSREIVERAEDVDVLAGATDEESNINGDHTSVNCTEPHLPAVANLPMPTTISLSTRMKQCFQKFSKKINLKALFAPSTIGAIVGFIIGMTPPFRKLLIGNDAPLHVIEDAASLLGDAAIPTVTLILGANLLRGLKGSDVQWRIIVGVLVIRYIFLPLLGILIVKGAVRFHLLQSDPLFQFVLLLQYALPPAMSIGTMTQLFGTGQSECSVIMLWTYSLASIALTLWCTLFLWLVAS